MNIYKIFSQKKFYNVSIFFAIYLITFELKKCKKKAVLK